ncbi:50S ribosomal protein L9 [Hydrogenivirga sp. 128-5-R1-1]|uniref:50S ribosomal protein L9 n=1 Tax=Hydrogenivirga sp. 128-5-R1-1 TaxID=392423 RepID=UPI00015F39C5|nr:50S ribosomal protein L9 [Hydrogenivirga sp. 128-5-R1-1]EDP75062.1 ribosomal protein L09 [Hydrogenivirga sp. 128-5-R1-1]
MKVVLTRDLEGYGFFGDVIEVKKGFANNYLIPRGYAVPATEGNVKHVQEVLRQKRRKIEREKKKAEELAKKLEGVVVRVTKPVGEAGKLFGSVTASDVVSALKEQGIEIDRKSVVFPHAIKQVGLYTITIRPHRDVSVEIKLDVKPEEKE